MNHFPLNGNGKGVIQKSVGNGTIFSDMQGTYLPSFFWGFKKFDSSPRRIASSSSSPPHLLICGTEVKGTLRTSLQVLHKEDFQCIPWHESSQTRYGGNRCGLAKTGLVDTGEKEGKKKKENETMASFRTTNSITPSACFCISLGTKI